jgi:hypothetical protein
MAWTMTITAQRPGVTAVTLDLNDSTNYYLLRYNPNNNGEAPTTGDTIELEVRGSSTAIVETNIAALRRALHWAAEYQSNKAQWRVHINYSPDGSRAARRSEIKSGVLVYDAASQDVYNYGMKRFKCTLIIERDNFGEEAVVNIPISNSNGTDVTAGLKVYNHNDRTGVSPSIKDDHFLIANTTVGDLPAPMRLTFLANGTTARAERLFVNGGINFDPTAAINSTMEGEAFTGATSTADANCAGGNYGAITVVAGVTKSISLYYGNPPYQWFGDNHRWMNVFRNPPAAGTYMRARMVSRTGGMSGATPWVLANTSYLMQDLGILRMPLTGPGQLLYTPGTPIGPLDFYLDFKNAAGATLNLDFTNYNKATYSRFYDCTQLTGTPVINDIPYDNQVNGFYNGVGSYAIPQPIGDPLHVVPGETMVYCMTWDANNGGTYVVENSQYNTVQAYYRPRYRSL